VAAFVVSPTALARAQGEAPPAPSTSPPSTPAPATDAVPAGAAADAPAGTPNKDETDDTKKKDAPKPAPATDTTTPADTSAATNDVSISVGAQPRKDEVKVDTKKSDDEEANRDPFAGSIVFWDHSVSTQTARLETSAQQSYIPTYEWWFSFQPRYNFSKRLSYRLRLDYTKELTNSQDSTYYREGLWGDVWNTIRFETPISERLKHTKVAISGTIKLPLSKESQGQGVYVKPGIGLGISQKITINGESAKWFPGAGLSLSGSYEHPFSRSTTSTTYGGFESFRQDTEGRTLVTDQISGGMLANHKTLAALRGDISFTEKWSASLSAILLSSWNYAPKEDVQVRTDTGMASVPRNSDSTLFSQSTWVILGTDYDLIDEVSLGLGYYNLAGIVASDGERRGVVTDHNIWWSPSARVFATVTANLDKIYERAAGIKPKKETAKRGPVPAGSGQSSPREF
jgi:hypothetical protein